MFLDNILLFGLILLYPYSIYIEEYYEEYVEIMKAYQKFSERVFSLYLFYNFLGKYDRIKWGLNDYEQISFTTCLILCMFPVHIYNLYWMIFYYHLRAGILISYICPLFFVINLW